MLFLETTAPTVSPIEFEMIPGELMWKFASNNDPEAPRYWVKLRDEVIMHDIMKVL